MHVLASLSAGLGIWTFVVWLAVWDRWMIFAACGLLVFAIVLFFLGEHLARLKAERELEETRTQCQCPRGAQLPPWSTLHRSGCPVRRAWER